MSPADQLPPFDDQAEAGALACVLSAENGDAGPMVDKLTLDCFYDQRHRAIFCALSKLHRERRPLDIVALSQAFRDKGQEEGAGGLEYLTALPDRTPSPANFPTFLETVLDRATRRAVLRDASELTRLAGDTTISPAALADGARRLLEANSRNGGNGNRLSIRSPDELLAMEFDDSDRILGDRLLATGQSLGIAGAGSIGKSRILLQLAVAIITGRPFLGFETRRQELRWLILQAENSNRRLQTDLAALREWTGSGAWARVNHQLAIHTLEADADGFLSLGDPSAQHRIAAAIADTKPDVVCFDSLYNFAIGDLNKDEDMGATLLALSRLAKAGDPARVIAVLHHALTGKAGAMRATGYDRASFGRNSKVLHSWARAQINIAPGSPDSNDLLVLTCGKCSNGKEFAPAAVKLNAETMIYEPAPDFDLGAWESAVAGGKHAQEQTVTFDRVRELCKGALTKKELARAIVDDAGCVKQYAYRFILKAEKARYIQFSKASEKYVARV